MTTYLISIATLGAINALLALGLMVLTPFTGYISLAAAAIAGCGAYAYAILTTAYGVPPVGAAIVAVLFGGLTGGAVSLVVARLAGEIHLLGTLALQLLAVELLRRWAPMTGGDAGIAGIPMMFEGMSVNILFCLAGGSLLAIAGGLRLWLGGAAGLRLRAIRDDREVAASAGCRLAQELVLAFIVSGMIMAYAGVLIAIHLSFLQPATFGIEWSMTILLMVMLGGASVVGCLIASFGLTVLPELIYFLISVPGLQVAAAQHVVYGLTLVALMLLRPRGLFGELRLRPPSYPRLESTSRG